MREPFFLTPLHAAVPSPADREEHAVRPITSRTVRPTAASRASDGRSQRRIVVLVVTAALALACLASVASGALAPQPGQRIDLRVLVIGATGTEPTFNAWKAELTREGVPFDAKVADAEGPFSDATFADYGSDHAKYEAVILANGDLVHQVTNPDGSVSFPSALADSEWLALAKFEQTFGIRQISDATFPSPVHGLNGPTNTGEQGGNTGTLTAAGLATFPYLKGPVPIDNPSPTATDAFGYQATPAAQVAPASFDTLLAGPNGSSYLGIYTHPDGREEMVMTVDSNENQLHAEILRHGMLSWVTRGVYLGYQRNYFEMQVDDVFLPDARWDTTLKRSLVDGPTAAPDETQCDPGTGQDQFIAGGGVVITPPPAPAAAGLPPCRPIRMTAADVTRLLTWQTTRGIKLDMVFNGAGSDEFKEDTGLANDPLADAFVANKDAFRWINHTFTHLNLDLLSAADLSAEIGNNIAWGIAHGLPMDPHELVTGEHSGLHNPNMAGTLNALGVTWVAADNSREPVQYTIGGATTVPRYPSNVYYNVETQVEQLDEYNFIYLPPAAGGKCVNSSTNTCRGTPATWAEYVDSEASIMFRHLMGNDPRPHFAHQSNLTADGVLYTVVDEVLNRYRRYFAPELVQLSHTDIGKTLRQQTVWAQDLAAGRVSAFLQDGQVHVTTTTTMDVPVTGTPQGTLYGGERPGWFTVTAGQPLVAQAPPDAAPVTRPGAPTTPAATPPAAPGATPPAARGATPPAAPGATPPAARGATPPAARGTKPPGANPPNRPGATPPRDADRPAAGTNGDRPGATSPANRSALRMTRLRMTPRRFAASHRRNVARRRRGHATDGTTITWLMSRPATVRLTVQLIRPGGRTSTVTSFTRKAITGENTVRFSGRIGRRTLRPGRYRMVVRATSADGARTAAQRLTFTVVRG